METLTPRDAQKYKFGKVIGGGASGIVKLVWDDSMKEFFVCKSIYKLILQDIIKWQDIQNVRRKFRSEIECMILLKDHPNIVQIIDAFEDEERYNIIMEVCQHGDLFDFISSKRVLEEHLVVSIVKQLASALDFCHSLGVYHGDVKPENVFVYSWETDSEGRAIPIVKLGDFGSSKLLNSKESPYQSSGTPHYMSPEVIQGKEASFKADVWSLGVIMYIMLSGTFPFDGKSTKELKSCILRKQIKFQSECWGKVSPLGLDLLTKMFERSPKNRISAEEVLEHPFIVDTLCMK